MSDQLQQLVALQPYPSQQLLSTGYMCAARYSQDMLWYRAIVRQPFQLKSTQVHVLRYCIHLTHSYTIHTVLIL